MERLFAKIKQNKYGSKCILNKVIQKKAKNAVCTNKYGQIVLIYY